MIRLLFATALCLSLPLTGIAQGYQKLPFDLSGAKGGLGGIEFGGKHGGNSDVKVTAELVAVDAEAVDVNVTVILPPHHHIYSHKTPFGIKTKIAIIASGFDLEGPIRSDREPDIVKEFGEVMEQFEDKVTWSQRLRSKSGPLQPGLTIKGELTGQYCSDTQCLMIEPPAKFEASLPADFVAPTAATTVKEVAGGSSTQTVIPKMTLPTGLSEPPIRFTVSLTPNDAQIGDFVKLSVKASIDKPFHTYSITQDPEILGGFPTVIDIETQSGLDNSSETFKASVAPEPKAGASADEVLELHHGNVEWTREFVVSDSPVAIGGTIHFQICNENSCQPPAKAKFLVHLGGEGSAVIPGLNVADNVDEFNQEGAQESWVGFIISAVSAGFIALLTPCVFPMIPVTVSYFLKQGEQSPGSTLKLALVYCLSIVAAFTGLGLMVSVVFGPEVLNQVANSVWLNLVFAVIFTAFSLMLLGMFEFQIPSWLLTWTSKKQETGGVLGVVFMALTFTLVSFTCTFAFVGNVLVLAANGESYLRPIVGMAAFSAAFASPFFLLAMFPSFLKSLPKSGGWMNRVKVTLGLLELAIVTKFLSVADIGLSPNGMPQYLDYHLVMGIWIAISIVTGMYLLNVFKMPHDTPTDSVGPLSCMFALGFLGVAAYISVGLFSPTAPNGALWQQIIAFAPPQLEISDEDGFVATHNGLDYALDFDAAVATASESNKPMFLDFTGVNCINCRKMENKVLSTDSVHDVLEDLVRVQLYMDTIPGAAAEPKVHSRLLARNHALQNDWLKDSTLPVYVIATPDGKEILAKFIGYNPSKPEFQKFLANGLQKWKDRESAEQQVTDKAVAAEGSQSLTFNGLQ